MERKKEQRTRNERMVSRTQRRKQDGRIHTYFIKLYKAMLITIFNIIIKRKLLMARNRKNPEVMLVSFMLHHHMLIHQLLGYQLTSHVPSYLDLKRFVQLIN